MRDTWIFEEQEGIVSSALHKEDDAMLALEMS
jgi:hypothetical protein